MTVALTKDDVHEIASEVVAACRKDVDAEIIKMHAKVVANDWTEERAKKIASMAAEQAVKQITDTFYLSVGKKTIATIGVLVVMAVVLAKDSLKSWAGMK